MHSSRVRIARLNGHLYGAISAWAGLGLSAWRGCPIAGWDTHTPVARQTPVKILPCLVLRLRAVISCEFVQVFNFNASWGGIHANCATATPLVLIRLVLNCIVQQ